MAKTKNIHVDIMEGNITRDAEGKNVGQDKFVLSFSVAVNDAYKDTETVSYFDCTMWGNYAKAMQPYLVKGAKVVVESRPKQDRWQNDQGQNRTKIVFGVINVRLVGGRSDNAGTNSQQHDDPEKIPETYDDDIPF